MSGEADERGGEPPYCVFDVGGCAYGSATMALTIARWAREHGRALAAASGCAIEPLRGSGLFEEVVPVNDETHAEVVASLLRRPGVRLAIDCSVSSEETRQHCERFGLPLISIDMHLWRRTPDFVRRPSAGGSVVCYERYPGFEEDLIRVGLGTGHPTLPPLMGQGRRAAVPPEDREDRVVVSLGGGDSPFIPYQRNAYPRLVAPIVAGVAGALPPAGSGWEIVFCCGRELARHLQGAGLPGRVLSLPRDEYLDLLARSRLLLSQPSIYSPCEAFQLDVPTVLLPPQNFTQCFHLEQWRRWGLALPATGLRELVPALALDPRGDEERQELAVQDALAEVIRDPARMEALIRTYREAVSSALGEGRPGLLSRQREAWRRLSQGGVAPLANLFTPRSGAAPRAAEAGP